PPDPPAIYTLSLHDALPIYTATASGGVSTGCSPAFRNPVQSGYHGLSRSLDQRNELFLGRTGFGASPRKRAECVGRALSSPWRRDRKSTRLNSSHRTISYAV